MSGLEVSSGRPAARSSAAFLRDDSAFVPTPALLCLPGSQQSTIFTGCDVAALPVCWSWPPGAVVLHHGLVGANVHAVHAPGLEAVVSARSRADGP